MIVVFFFLSKISYVHIRVQNYLLISFLQRLWRYFIKKKLVHFDTQLKKTPYPCED